MQPSTPYVTVYHMYIMDAVHLVRVVRQIQENQ